MLLIACFISDSSSLALFSIWFFSAAVIAAVAAVALNAFSSAADCSAAPSGAGGSFILNILSVSIFAFVANLACISAYSDANPACSVASNTSAFFNSCFCLFCKICCVSCCFFSYAFNINSFVSTIFNWRVGFIIVHSFSSWSICCCNCSAAFNLLCNSVMIWVCECTKSFAFVLDCAIFSASVVEGLSIYIYIYTCGKIEL